MLLSFVLLYDVDMPYDIFLVSNDILCSRLRAIVCQHHSSIIFCHSHLIIAVDSIHMNMRICDSRVGKKWRAVVSLETIPRFRRLCASFPLHS